jgi:transposase
MMSRKMMKQSDRVGGKRRNFTKEYKAEVVRLVTSTGRSSFEVARELGLSGSAVRQWVKQAEVDAGRGPSGALTTSEREELAQLRRENRVLRQERDILRRATALFAKEGMS